MSLKKLIIKEKQKINSKLNAWPKKNSNNNFLDILLLTGEALRDADNCEFVPIYEDKDGDWMLAGDVPWE